MDSPYAQELKIAFATVRAASKLSQSIIASSDKGVIDKDSADDGFNPVTVADFAIQALLSATFRHHFPEDGLVGEESADELRSNPKLMARVGELLAGMADPGSAPLYKVPKTDEATCELVDACGSGTPRPGRVWVFDPIDGTIGYVRGEIYAINIALLVDGKQILSAVACPNLSPDASGPVSNTDLDPSGRGSLLFAVKGHGAYIMPLREQEGQLTKPRRLSPHPVEARKEDLRLVCSNTLSTSGSPEFHAAVANSLGMDFPGCNLLPWVARWATMAMGLANTTVWVYNRYGRRAKIWDHAGAMLLFEETGGKITDVFGRDMDLGVGRVMANNFGFVASLPCLHQTVLGATHQKLREFSREDVLAELKRHD